MSPSFAQWLRQQGGSETPPVEGGPGAALQSWRWIPTGRQDPLFAEARALARGPSPLSLSLLQRTFRLGDRRALRLHEALTQPGVAQEPLPLLIWECIPPDPTQAARCSLQPGRPVPRRNSLLALNAMMERECLQTIPPASAEQAQAWLHNPCLHAMQGLRIKPLKAVHVYTMMEVMRDWFAREDALLQALARKTGQPAKAEIFYRWFAGLALQFRVRRQAALDGHPLQQRAAPWVRGMGGSLACMRDVVMLVPLCVHAGSREDFGALEPWAQVLLRRWGPELLARWTISVASLGYLGLMQACAEPIDDARWAACYEATDLLWRQAWRGWQAMHC
jgi:hypothetical protein